MRGAFGSASLLPVNDRGQGTCLCSTCTGTGEVTEGTLELLNHMDGMVRLLCISSFSCQGGRGWG